MSASSSDRAERAVDDPVLSVEGLRKEFQGVVALDGVTLDVGEGEVVGIVGPNGAGKTTLFNCIMGEYAPTAGRVTLQGRNVTDLSTAAIVDRGMSRTFQIPRVFPDLTVEENMQIYQPHHDESILATLFQRTDQATNGRIDELLSYVGIEDMQSAEAGSLSTGQQKLLNFGAALLREPAVVLLDEPAAGVNPKLVETIKEMIVDLGRDGQTFVVIEHEMDVVREITDFVYVLANGTNLTAGPPEEALNDPRVLEAYFGE
jgi:branched-chain amino acid transport system ATP-binding protein